MPVMPARCIALRAMPGVSAALACAGTFAVPYPTCADAA